MVSIGAMLVGMISGMICGAVIAATIGGGPQDWILGGAAIGATWTTVVSS